MHMRMVLIGAVMDGQRVKWPFQIQQAKWINYRRLKVMSIHVCPGINGGYIANPNVKFGVNCYGHKQIYHLLKQN